LEFGAISVEALVMVARKKVWSEVEVDPRSATPPLANPPPPQPLHSFFPFFNPASEGTVKIQTLEDALYNSADSGNGAARYVFLAAHIPRHSHFHTPYWRCTD
jgi:hypothetical protein